MFKCVLFSSSMQTRSFDRLLDIFQCSNPFFRFYESNLSGSFQKTLLKLSESSPQDLRKQADFSWKPSESKLTFVESSPKAGWLSLSALKKQDDFRWELYESRMTFVENSTKAGWLLLRALQKQDDFRWVLYKNRMTFIECSTKAGWLAFSALQKQEDFR